MMHALLSFLFPKKCVFCGAMLSATAPICICASCAARIPYYKGEYLFEGGGTSIGKSCNRIICALKYAGSVRKVISGFKFYGRREYGLTLAALLCERIISIYRQRPLSESGAQGMKGAVLEYEAAGGIREAFDIITCVPLSRGRLRERGYNQAAILAAYTARHFGIPIENGLLIRDDQTLRQSSLKRGERRANVQAAFQVNWEKAYGIISLSRNKRLQSDLPLKGARILLVDDIATSMSTINACAASLKAAGAAEVVGAVLAAP